MATALERIQAVTGNRPQFDPAREIWGVLFVNMGGPEKTEEIRPYLYNIFSDRAVINFPLAPLLQKPMARLISTLSRKKSRCTLQSDWRRFTPVEL